jgi:ferredoxin-NADP reductase/ferredoxin
MSDYQIQLTTRDGQSLEFVCASEGDVIHAAEKAGILLPSLCKDGGCGACITHCAEGDYHLSTHNKIALSDESAARRDVLLCCTYPSSNLKIIAPYNYIDIGFGKKQAARQAVITVIETIAERTMQLKLRWLNQDDQTVEFEPGQFMELEIPNTDVNRAYSIANTPNWRGELEFLIRLQPSGQFSTYLSEQAEVGQVLNVSGPGGAFGLQAGRLNPAIFVAGGTGLAPFLSTLRRMVEWGEYHTIHLLFGVNQENELFYTDELQKLQKQLSDLSVELCVWKPQGDWHGFKGTPAEALQQYLQQNPGVYDVYLCGPPQLIDAATAIALENGLTEEQIFAEKFG